MASARSTKQGPAKPRGAVKPKAPPRERFAPLDVLPVIEKEAWWEIPDFAPDVEEQEEIPAPEPEPEPRFPFEKSRGEDPVAVFNSPDSWNESLAFPKADRRHPLKFSRGLLAVFTEEDAAVVRSANPGGKVYVEADPRLAHSPLICSTCYPKTRWYSTVSYERHMRRAHSNG